MRKFFTLLFKVIGTFFAEPKYVAAALFGGETKLPPYYWRFMLLRPVMGHDDIMTSPLGRNFCPLFWATNALLILYVFVGWVVLLVYGLGHLILKLWQYGKVNRRRHFNYTPNSSRDLILGKALFESQSSFGIMATLREREDYDPEKPIISLKNWITSHDKHDEEWLDANRVLLYLNFKKKFKDKAEEKLRQLEEIRKVREEQADAARRAYVQKVKEAVKVKEVRKESKGTKLAALTPIFKKITQAVLFTLLAAAVVGMCYILFLHLGIIAAGLKVVWLGVVDLMVSFFKMLFNWKIWSIVFSGALAVFLCIKWLAAVMDYIIEKGLDFDEKIVSTTDSILKLKLIKEKESSFIAQVAPEMNSESGTWGKLFVLLCGIGGSVIIDPCVWFYENVLSPVIGWIIFPIDLIKMTLSNHCPKITIVDDEPEDDDND
jgi:hypothetical protein